MAAAWSEADVVWEQVAGKGYPQKNWLMKVKAMPFFWRVEKFREAQPWPFSDVRLLCPPQVSEPDDWPVSLMKWAQPMDSQVFIFM